MEKTTEKGNTVKLSNVHPELTNTAEPSFAALVKNLQRAILVGTVAGGILARNPKPSGMGVQHTAEDIRRIVDELEKLL